MLYDIVAAGGIDLARLERGLGLRSERMGRGRYRVTSGSDQHWVDLYRSAHPKCDCGAHLWRDRICKHIIAALLREGNEQVLTMLPRLFNRFKDAA